MNTTTTTRDAALGRMLIDIHARTEMHEQALAIAREDVALVTEALGSAVGLLDELTPDHAEMLDAFPHAVSTALKECNSFELHDFAEAAKRIFDEHEGWTGGRTYKRLCDLLEYQSSVIDEADAQVIAAFDEDRPKG